VKDVSVIGVDEAATTWPPDERGRSQPAIKESRNSADRSGLRCVRVNHVRALALEETIEFPDGERVFRRNLAAHLRNDERLDSMLSGKVTHLIFARRHSSRDEERLAFRALQSGSEPDDVTRWPADIEPGDDTKDFHKSGVWSLESGVRRSKANLFSAFDSRLQTPDSRLFSHLL